MNKLIKIRHLPVKIKSPLFAETVQRFLSGKIHFVTELPFSQETIAYYKTQQLISIESGIQNKSCRRCFSKRLHHFNCAQCEKRCSYCVHCIRMGRVSICSELVFWKGPAILAEQKLIVGSWQLTVRQQQVVHRCLATERDFLIHAVTGAGKTEILFPIIAAYLKRGARVCLATPRTDVVLELIPRFQAAFPQQVIHGLYGGSDKPQTYSTFIIATTHQLFRFEAAFDLLIVDEADAFPYSYDRQLEKAVQKAKKTAGRLILMTATPNLPTRRQYEKKGSYAFVSRRFHEADLPVPIYASLWRYKSQLMKGRIPKKLKNWVAKCLENKQPFLVFFPSIQLMEQAAPLFQMLHRKILSVHAADDRRKDAVQALRERRIPGLLTTTILERGITIPSLQVAVVGAEEAVFTTSALIQICGRVGRSPIATTGEIIFFHHGISMRMDEAKYEIQRLNRLETMR